MSQLPESMRRGADLATVAQAIADATALPGPIYVERRADRYRWSPTHRGGPYPLLRETAKLLGIDYHFLILPCALLPGTQLTIVAEPGFEPPDAWVLLERSPASDAQSVAHRIRSALNS